MNIKNSLINNINEVISILETNVKSKIPKIYFDFLVSTNGGEPDKHYFQGKYNENLGHVRCFLGVQSKSYNNLLSTYHTYKERIPYNTIAIGYDSCDNLILLSVKGADFGKVYFWDHELEADEGEEADYSNLTLIADSFDEFLSMLKSEDEIDALLNEPKS